jgi:hypothetical protein
MKKLLVVAVTFVAVASLRAEEVQKPGTDHTASTSTAAVTPAVTQKVAPESLTADKLSKLHQYIQACSVARPSIGENSSKLFQ